MKLSDYLKEQQITERSFFEKYVLDADTEVDCVVRGCESELHQCNVLWGKMSECNGYLYHLDDNLYVIEIDYAGYYNSDFEVYNTLEEGQERLKELENSCSYPSLDELFEDYYFKYGVVIDMKYMLLSSYFIVKYNDECILETESIEESEEIIKDIVNLIGTYINGNDIQHIKVSSLKSIAGNKEEVEVIINQGNGKTIECSKIFEEKEFRAKSFKELFYENFDSFFDNEKGMEL